MSNLEEQAKELAKYLEGKKNDWCVVESYFIQIRKDALEDALTVCSTLESGELDIDQEHNRCGCRGRVRALVVRAEE